MDTQVTIEKIIRSLDEVNNITHNKYHEVAQNNNLTLDQFHLLLHLERKKVPPTINDIAASANIAKNTMSEKITRFEEKGFIKKIKDTKDKRITRVILTDKGKKFIEKISQEVTNEYIYKSLDKMGEKDLEEFYKYIQTFINNLKEI